MTNTQNGSFAVLTPNQSGYGWVIAGVGRLVGSSSVAYQRTAKRVDTTDDEGQLVNVLFFDFGKTVQIQCFPRGTNEAAASAANRVDIKPGTVIKLSTLNGSAAADTNIAAAASTAWVGDGATDTSNAQVGTVYFVSSFSKTHEAGNKVRWDITLEKPDAMTITQPN